jgi:ppGpp synthetase/RelA/SpoT-type nucleotidyltranferase
MLQRRHHPVSRVKQQPPFLDKDPGGKERRGVGGDREVWGYCMLLGPMSTLANDVEKLRLDWEQVYPSAQKFAAELEQQITKLLADEKIYLAVPLQSRVKTWESLEEKLSRKALTLAGVKELHDLVGLRIILLFQRDVKKACEQLNKYMKVIEQYDTAERLQENQFGYASTHVILTLPDAWLQVPTFAPLKGLVAEVQVRTVAQHVWAAASHALQYKAEASVPVSVRRSINRVSALLETVDLEYERVLDERQRYREAAMEQPSSEPLNVDLLEGLMAALLPAENKVPDEDYDGLLQDLLKAGVNNGEQLKQLVAKHGEKLLENDHRLAKRMATEATESLGSTERQRAVAGIWFSQTGLVRDLLRMEFGDRFTAQPQSGRKLISTRLNK